MGRGKENEIEIIKRERNTRRYLIRGRVLKRDRRYVSDVLFMYAVVHVRVNRSTKKQSPRVISRSPPSLDKITGHV